jgi:single-strand DNA-binding protein
MQTNKVTLIGYIGNHLKTRTSINSSKRTSIRLATHFYEKKENKSSICHTTWHDVVAWNKVADYAERSFVIGSKIMVEGSIEYKTYTDYHGHTRYVTIIKAHSLLNLDR